MTRAPRLAVVLAVVVAAVGMAWPAQAAEYEFTYVAGDLQGDSDATAYLDAPGLHVRPTGSFAVEPAGTTFTIRIDDFGAADGSTIPVTVQGQGYRVLFSGCMPVRSVTTVRGATRGGYTSVFIGHLDGLPECSAIATAGIATVGGVK